MIKVGDLVMVVKPTLCCGVPHRLGWPFTVGEVTRATGQLARELAAAQARIAELERLVEGWQIAHKADAAQIAELERTLKDHLESWGTVRMSAGGK